MFFHKIPKSALPRFACALAVCLLFATAETALAQRGGRPRAGGGGGQKPKADVPAGSKKPTSTIGKEPGSFRGQIAKFEPTTDEKDEDLLGYLTIRPTEKGAKTLKLQIRRVEEQQTAKNDCVSLGTHAFDADAYGDVLWKGLYCDVSWDWLRKEGDSEKKKPTIRVLKKLTFDTIAVEGKIEEVEGEFLTIKVRPAAGREWPDSEGKETPTAGQMGKATDTAKVKQAVAKKLRVKIFDDVTAFKDAAKQSLEMGDFAVDQQIVATVVYGKSDGILVELQSLTAEEKKDGEKPGAKPAGPAQPQQPGGRPRGGRVRAR
jgi:hypothetical protein